MPRTQTWEKTEGAVQYIVDYSTDNFEHVIRLAVDSNSLDCFQLPEGIYRVRVKPAGDSEWMEIGPVVAEEVSDDPKLVRSNADGNADAFFVNAVGTWECGYAAQHVGSADDAWGGTMERAALIGKNKLTDVIEGSADANILLMTDDDNGDALFVDDIYSASPDELGLTQSRIARIDEIRAGAGDDIVDMTSQRFEYIGGGLLICGGDGDDIIWANKGENFLFGDAGNDRIVGASGRDLIVGGSGNDRMHGGGGDDIFTFCGDWGVDTVEQIADGKVTLWFMEGGSENWNESTLTYTEGENSVTVSGVSADKIELIFAYTDDDTFTMFEKLSAAAAFDAFSSRKCFDEEPAGFLAGL